MTQMLYDAAMINRDTNQTYLQDIIDTSLIFGENIPFWQECFDLDGNEKQADLSEMKLSPSWTVLSYKKRMVPMAEAMAPLSEGPQLENEGYTTNSGSMYEYGSGLFQTSLGQMALQAKLQNLNVKERSMIGGFVKDATDMVKAHNSRLSNLAAQVLSKGGAYSSEGQGNARISTPQPAYIPITNYLKAGTKVWTDPTCDLPEQMRAIEDDVRMRKGIAADYPMQWDIPYNMVRDVLLKNAKFIEQVNQYIRYFAPTQIQVIAVGPNGSSTSATDTSVITMDQLVAYSKMPELSKISPIHIVQEKQSYNDGRNYPITQGWATGVAVFRPAGPAGVVVHGVPKDVAVFNSGEINNTVSINIARVAGFLYLINKVSPDGMLNKYSSDVLGCYAPVLNETMLHFVIDTSTANS
ncbi:MAG: hypothetical protein WCQ87_03100 [Parabacteroides sp.]